MHEHLTVKKICLRRSSLQDEFREGCPKSVDLVPETIDAVRQLIGALRQLILQDRQ